MALHVDCFHSSITARILQRATAGFHSIFKRATVMSCEQESSLRVPCALSRFVLLRTSQPASMDRQASVSSFISRFISADCAVAPVALAPGGLGTEATKIPADSSTLNG
jgi:hypothetical protein